MGPRGRGAGPRGWLAAATGAEGAVTLAVLGGAAALALLLKATTASAPAIAWLHAAGAAGALFLATLGGLAVASERTRARGRRRALPPARSAARARTHEAARLAGGLLILAGAFALLIDGTASALGLDETGPPERPAPGPGLDPRGTPAPDSRTAPPDTARLVDPDGDARASLPSSLLSTAPVLEVRRVEGPVDPATTALHLRGFVLTDFDRGGAPTSPPRRRRPLAPAPDRSASRAIIDPLGGARATEETLTLELRPLAPGDGTVFAPAPLLALVGDAATVEPERELIRVAPRTPSTVVSGLPSPAGLASASARGSVPPDSRWLALPPAAVGSSREADLARIAEFARESAGRAGSAGPDLARILGVVQRLRRDFGYDLVDTSFPTPRGCVALLERRTGSCTHFATTATLALRTMGIPARVAAGYIARESTADGSAWLVRARDGHAWVEVHFEGLGWWAFDPTPPASGVANPAWTPLEIEGARPRGIAGLVVRLASSVSRALEGRGGWPVVLAAAGAVALAVALLRRGRGSNGPGLPPARPPVRGGAAARLCGVLRARGIVQRESETPLAFARRADASIAELGAAAERVGAASPPRLARDEIEGCTRLLLRADARGVDLDAEAASRIEALAEALETTSAQ